VIKPLGVLVVLGCVLVLVLCLFLALWGIVRCMRRRARKTAAVLGIAAVGIAVLSACAICAVAPKGGRTIAQLDLADGCAFVVRHYRHGWFEYPKVRFYSRDMQGAWTSFALIAELVDPNDTTLVLDASEQEIEVPGVGCYSIRNNDFVNVDGSRGTKWQLPPGVEPADEDIHGGVVSPPQ